MPKARDLRLEREIIQLRSQGLGVRGIARRLHVSPATVSRYLRRDVNRKLLEGLTRNLEEVELTLRLTHQSLTAMGATYLYPGQPTMTHKERLSAALRDWPGQYRQHN